MMERFGAVVTMEEAREMVRTADGRGDGAIDLEQFRRLLHSDHLHAQFASPCVLPTSPTDSVPPMFFTRQQSSPLH